MPDDEQLPPPAPDDDALTHLRTAWHPVLVILLELLLPGDLWRVAAEYVLTREPRRIDAVIVRRVADAASRWHPDYLRSVLDDLLPHNVVHFKGATDALERSDALQLLSYAFQYMALEGVERPHDLSLRVVAPTLTPRFRAQVEALGGALAETPERGVHTGALQGFALRVVETTVAWPAEGEHLLYAMTLECVTDPGRILTFDDRERELFYHLLQRINRLVNDPRWKVIMKDATLVKASASQALRELLASLSPEDRLAGLPPEARLAGLPVAQTVLALPDEVLRGLSPAYLATLPADVQAAVRARLAR
ncbi:MAG: hypothetical protein U0324_37345 [Polyangiales bacterium]